MANLPGEGTTWLVAILNDDGTLKKALPMPSTYTANTADLVDSARNVNGVVVGSVIRSDVAKVELSWNILTMAQWADVLAQFNGKGTGKFYNKVRFLNQVTNKFETRTMYVSDRSNGGIIQNIGPGATGFYGWQSCQLSLVEQ